MGIQKFIEKVCVQTAVYWGVPTEDGRGGKTYADGIEIQCRWDSVTQKKMDLGTIKDGNVYSSMTKVLVTQDLELDGYLYLGTIADLNALGLNSMISDFRPNEVEGAYVIKKIEKIPMIKKTDVFVRTVYV